MSDQDEMAPQTPQTNFNAYQVTIRLRERAALMIGAAMEEAAMLDVAIEGQALEIKGLRKSLEMMEREWRTVKDLLTAELNYTDQARELLIEAHRLVYECGVFVPSESPTLEEMSAFLERVVTLIPELLMTPLPEDDQSSNGESDLTTSPEE